MLVRIYRHIAGCIDRLIGIAKRHFLPAIIVLYIFVVIIFAAVNWLMFLTNSTSYLISDQLNKHVERYEFLSPEIDLATYHENAKDNIPITISEFSVKLKQDLEKLQATNDSLDIKEKVLSDSRERWDSLSKVALGIREDSVNKVRKKLLAGSQERIDSLKRFLEGKDSTQMIIDGKYVELAKLQYEYAKKKVQVETMFSQYIGNFIPDSLSHQIRKCNDDYIWLTMDIQHLEGERRDVSSRIRYMVAEFHRNRLESVSLLDFLYYSICVSTTVSFGDIAPNDGVTRFLAIIELLICLVLVGAIVDRIIKKKR